MKRSLLILVVLLALVVTVIAPVAAQDNSITVWSRIDLSATDDPNATALNAFIEQFTADTGITVNYEQVAWDQLSTRLIVAVTSGGDVPDIVEAGSQHIPSLLDAGALAPLDDLLADLPWVSELTTGDTAACVVEDVRYCVANNVRGGLTYFQNGDFPDGFPATADDWMAASGALPEGREYFTTFFAGRSYGAIEIAWWPLIYSNGGEIFDDEGRPAWATEEVAEVVEFARQQLASGAMPEVNVTGDFSDAEAPWIEGQAASFRGGSWSAIFVPGLQASVDAGDVGITGGVDFGGGSYVFMVSEGWVVPTGAANPEGATAWLNAFMQPEFLASWAQAQFGIPTTTAAYESAEFDSAFYSQVDSVLGSQGLYMEQSPFYVESLDELAIAWQELLLDPELDTMTRLQEAADAVVQRYW
jgi:multiple sugar transport system substrate-binding protein